MNRPDLYDVLSVARLLPGAGTYVIRNVLHSQGYRGVKTSLVLRRMNRLQALGKVERCRSSYASQINWRPVPEARAASIEVREIGRIGEEG